VAIDTRVDASANGLKFRTHARDVTVTTDPIILETMVRNLVANALKFTKRGGILLAVRRHGDRVGLEIYDTGPGIPAERQELVFVEFDRAREHATGTNEGLGLGLSIVKRYGELLGIDITVCSRMGHGTRFSMWLPVHALQGGEQDGISVDKNAFMVSGHNLAGMRVLVADDDAAIVAALRRDLEDQGCLVSVVNSAEDLESQWSEVGEIDVAVVDYNLWQGMTGLELLSLLETSLGRPIVALIISGATDPETLNSIQFSGRPWLTKPVDSEAIADKLWELSYQMGPRANLGRS
jgi:CheY-like chemotaxis protein/anti-sigma regulatory factor (Ser/Thr protein kinase)